MGSGHLGVQGSKQTLTLPFPSLCPGAHCFTSLCPNCQLEIILLILAYIYQALSFIEY